MPETPATCTTCDGYAFIPTPGQHQLERCPHCLPIAHICPVHKLTATSVNSRITQSCPACDTEERTAHRLLRRNRVALQAAA